MKKRSSYILILIAFVGIFGLAPVHNAKAEDYGDCTITTKGLFGDVTTVSKDKTYQSCKDISSSGEWVKKYSSDPTPAQPTKTACPITNPTCNTPASSVPTQTTPEGALPGTGTNTLKGTTSITTPVDTTYHLLAPLPCRDTDPNCKDGQITTFDPTQADNLGAYLNLMITTFIGICAVLAVIMIVIGGIEYMTSELPSTKSNGISRMVNAVGGLVLALGAYILLYTINPDLLKTNFSSLKTASVAVQTFSISSSGPQSRYGTAVKIDFNSQAYPAAVAAQAKTGINPALTLAIFAQETSNGANTGACFPANANMTSDQQAALASIISQLGQGGDVSTTHVSCSLSSGHGGAIGLTQFMPVTWNAVAQKENAAGILGHPPDPWNTNDALMMTALFLKEKGGVNNPTQAACSYFGSCSSGNVNYSSDIASKMANLQSQIDAAKASGKIK